MLPMGAYFWIPLQFTSDVAKFDGTAAKQIFWLPELSLENGQLPISERDTLCSLHAMPSVDLYPIVFAFSLSLFLLEALLSFFFESAVPTAEVGFAGFGDEVM
jgi:hypothetical protein